MTLEEIEDKIEATRNSLARRSLDGDAERVLGELLVWLVREREGAIQRDNIYQPHQHERMGK